MQDDSVTTTCLLTRLVEQGKCSEQAQLIPLDLGHSNANYQLIDGDGMWFCKQFTLTNEVDRNAQVHNETVLSHLDLALAPTYFDKANGIALYPWHPQGSVNQAPLNTSEWLNLLADRISLCRRVDLALLKLASWDGVKYVAQCRNTQTTPVPKVLAQATDWLLKHSSHFQYDDAEAGLCHNDLSAANVLAHHHLVIDWECANIGPLEQELGFCFAVNDFTLDSRKSLVTKLQTLGLEVNVTRLHAYYLLALSVNALWYLRQATPFRPYTQQIESACSQIKQLFKYG